MFDFSWSEIALIVMVALVCIGPKDLPVAIRAVGKAIRSVRHFASEFQSHVEDMVKEIDLSDARKHWQDLTNFDLTKRFSDTIDSDGRLEKELAIDLPSHLAHPQTPCLDDESHPVSDGSDIAPSLQSLASYEAITPVSEQTCTLPSILPPVVAKRLASERARMEAPKILPPVRVTHHGQRVTVNFKKDKA